MNKLWLVMIVCGILIGGSAWWATAGSRTTQWVPIENSMSTPATSTPAAEIKWQPTLDAAIKEAKSNGKPIMADFYATWCGPCKMLDEETYPDPKVAAEAQRWVMVKIDVDENQQIAQQYNATALPTILFLNSDGKPVTGFQGFTPPDDMLEQMQKAYPQVQ